ncbi:MAG: hypothetical protein V7L11_30225 [Nostoc sp.]|uniref:hypothetical protein n=1 Tax=Nostoc sp. TaxID=1180 RepID=UPI002FF7E992
MLTQKQIYAYALLTPRSLSPRYEYIEGGDFRDTLNLYANRVSTMGVAATPQDLQPSGDDRTQSCL